MDGLTSQASSSKPLLTTSFCAGVGTEANGVATPSWVGLSFGSCEKAFGSTTSLVWTAGAGRPFRVLFFKVPPGPEKRPVPDSPSGLIISSPPKLTPLFAPARPYFLSKNLITLMISPSRKPNVRRFVASMSGKTLSSIESLAKACAYRSHSPTATSHERKN